MGRGGRAGKVSLNEGTSEGSLRKSESARGSRDRSRDAPLQLKFGIDGVRSFERHEIDHASLLPMHEVVDDVLEHVVLRVQVEQCAVVGKAERRTTDVEEAPKERALQDVPLQDACVLEEEERLPRLELNGWSASHGREYRGLPSPRKGVPAWRDASVPSLWRIVTLVGQKVLLVIAQVNLVVRRQLAAEEDLDWQRAKVNRCELIRTERAVELSDGARKGGASGKGREELVPGRVCEFDGVLVCFYKVRTPTCPFRERPHAYVAALPPPS